MEWQPPRQAGWTAETFTFQRSGHPSGQSLVVKPILIDRKPISRAQAEEPEHAYMTFLSEQMYTGN